MSNIDIDKYVESLSKGYNIAYDTECGFQVMVNECKYNGLKKALTNAFGSYYSTLIYEGKFDKLVPDLAELRNITTQIGENKTTEYIFITINPKPTITFETFQEYISGKKQNLLNKKWMKDFMYVYEQRGEVEHDYKGYHLHMVLKRNGKKMFDIRKEFKSTLKSIMDVDNPHCLNFKNIKDEPDLIRRIKYITDFKADEDKHKKQYNDVHFRRHFNLKRYYKDNDHYDIYLTKITDIDVSNSDLSDSDSDLPC